MEDHRRYRFLEDHPALEQPGWLPPATEVAELAHLRADHDRLLDAVGETLREAGALRRTRNAELEAQRAAQEAAFLGGAQEPVPELTVTEDQIEQATKRAEAARDALQSFVRSAIEEVCEREPVLLDQLDETVATADVKRAEAEAILAEAEALEAGTRRMRQWLGRTTGRSALGHYSYEQMPTPDGNGGAVNLTVAELYAAQNPGIGFEELHEVADGNGAFGTDYAENLGPDDAPWEQTLAKEALHGN